ncbi:hypothetical protein HK104_006030 [Borealophlyctis nickersoniae]|nr:hypothetical protein HK104_006030 [Borealophlyctis nickersoniae]
MSASTTLPPSAETTTQPTPRLTPDEFFNSINTKKPTKEELRDLDRQIAYLVEKYPGHTVIKDIGSGVSYKRPGLCNLVKRCIKGLVEEVVVAHRDRLVRFGFELFELIFHTCHVKLVIDDREGNGSYDVGSRDGPQQLAEDLMAIVHSTAREAMAENVSEAREQMAYGKAKAIATWYLNQCKDKENNSRANLNMTQEEALEAKQRIDKEEALRRKKNREREESVEGGGGGSEAKKRRTKYLKKSAEEIAHWGARAEVRRQKAKEKQAKIGDEKADHSNRELGDGGDGGDGPHGQPAGKSPEAVRSMSLRLYPSEALEKGLLRWIEIADAMDEHAKEVVEEFAARGETISFEYARNEYVCLGSRQYENMRKGNRLGEIKDLERRKAYLEMPYDVQQAAVKETVGNAKANQTNYEKGHNKGYEMRGRDRGRRWKTLNFGASGMCVDKKTGEVSIYPRSKFVPQVKDHILYVKDRILRFACPEKESRGGRKIRVPMKPWGRYLLCGKKTGGKGFKIRYDSLTRKWYLILSYDAKVRGAPFRPEVLEEILRDQRREAARAKKWIMRSENLFDRDVPRGNMCSIDPGTRVPWTCFDAHRRSFYDVYPDLVSKLANLHNDIALLQHRKDTGGVKGGRSGYLKRKRARKRAQGKKRKRKRNWSPSCQRRMNRLHDRMKAIVRQAHGAFANHLVRYYDVIVLPEFMTAGMVRKRRQLLKLPPMRDREDVNTAPREGKFTLHKTTRKAMRWISHHAFRKRCFAKALADPNEIKDVICTTEEYSTKQCPFCDFVHHKIGSNKIYKCGNAECGFEGWRDNVGGFNIGVRSLVKNEVRVLL